MERFKFQTEIDLLDDIKLEGEDDSDMIGCDDFNELISVVDVNCSYTNQDCYETVDDFNLDSLETFDDFSNIENYPTFSNTNPDETNFSNTETEICAPMQLSGNGFVIMQEDDSILNLCKICAKGFSSKNDLKRHYNEDHDQYFCLNCDEEFDSVSLYRRHLESHPEEEKNCSICRKRFSCKKARNFHTDTAHFKVKHKECPYCNFSSPLFRVLKLHVDRHEKNTRFQCAECDKKFYRKCDLNVHNLSAHGPGTKCEMCDRVYRSKSSLMVHKRNRHFDSLFLNKDVNTNFKCDFCCKNILDRHDFEWHIMNHLGILKSRNSDDSKTVKKFPCDFCNKIMPDRGSFERHIMEHLGITKSKRYCCKICKFKTSRRRSLKKHQKCHASKKYLICDFCEKKFLDLESLEKHKRNHEREKRKSEILNGQNSCEIPSRDRTAEKKLQCGKCNETFFNNFSLKMHITTKH